LPLASALTLSSPLQTSHPCSKLATAGQEALPQSSLHLKIRSGHAAFSDSTPWCKNFCTLPPSWAPDTQKGIALHLRVSELPGFLESAMLVYVKTLALRPHPRSYPSHHHHLRLCRACPGTRGHPAQGGECTTGAWLRCTTVCSVPQGWGPRASPFSGGPQDEEADAFLCNAFLGALHCTRI